MKILKRFGMAVVAICMITFLGGCDKNQYGLDPESPTVITLWHYYNSAQKIAFDSYVDEFNQTIGRKMGIVVKAYSQSSPASLAEAVNDAAAKKVGSAPMPDIFATYVDTAQQIDQSYGLANMDQYITEKELADYIPAYIEEGRIGPNQELRIFPVAKSTEVLMLNATDWLKFAKDAHVDMDTLLTWEGLADVAEKYYHYTNNLTAAPNDGKAFFCRDAVANYILIGSMQLGEEIFQQDQQGGHAVLNEQVMRRLWDNYYIPYVKGFYSKQGRFATDDAKLGDVIAIIGANTGATFLPEEIYLDDDTVYPVEILILPLPNFADAAPMAVQQGAGMAISKSDEKHEYASMVFLKWFTQPERNVGFAVESAYLPVTKEGSRIEAFEEWKEERGTTPKPIVEEAIRVSILQTQRYQLYTSKPIYNGYAIREQLEMSLNEKAQQDQQAVKDALANGQSREAALAPYLTDENFLSWYSDINGKIDALMERD